MTRDRFVRVLAVALAAGFGPGGVRIARSDTITFVGTRSPLEQVTIVDERVDVVEYQATRAGPKLSIPSFEIADVRYADPGEAFRRADQLFDTSADASVGETDARGFVTAAEQFLEAASRSGKRKALAARSLLFAGRAFSRAGDPSRASEAWKRIEQEHSRSRYASLALLELGRLLEAVGDDAGARDAYVELRAKDERAAFVARLRIALLDAAVTDTEDAVSRLTHECDAVESQAGTKYADVIRLVRLGRGVVERRSGRPDAAVAIFRALVDEGDSAERDVRAAAWNGIGVALQSSPEVSPERVERALLAHLRVVTQFADVVAEQPEALYLAAKCFQRSESADRDSRAADLLARCRQGFPGSRFARLAARG